MMHIDHPDRTPLPPRATQKLPKRPTPCAGLFGWRKQAEDKPAKAPDGDYPAR